MVYRYPSRDSDRADVLLGLLGSYWCCTYEGAHQVGSFTYARGREEEQTYLNLLEAIASVSRFEVPLFHTDLWYLLTLKESEMQHTAIPAYGSERTYNDGLNFGAAQPTSDYAFPIPADLVGANLLFNRITDPSVSFGSGLDFIVDPDRSRIHFRANPFANSLIPSRHVYQDDQVINREAALWTFRGQFDWRHTYNHFGFVLGLRLKSSKQYRDLVNAVFDSLVEGANYAAMAAAMSAITDVPIVLEAEETVQVVVTDSRHLLIVTDQHVYELNPDCTPLVAVGDTVRAGDQLVDAVAIYEFNRGQTPADLRALTIGDGYLLQGYHDGLTFQNKKVPLVVDTTGVFTKVSFEIGGWAADITKFWDDFHERGVAAGQTLAQLLDQRANKDGEPTAAALPATINPLSFLIENVLRNNAFVVKVKPHLFGEHSLGLVYTRQLRRLVPPHVGYLLVMELAANADVITMSGPGSAETPGYEEDVIAYQAGEPISETIDPATYISEEVTGRYIDGVCL